MLDNQQLAIDSLPDFQQVEFEEIDPNAPWEAFWSWTLFFVPLLTILVTSFFLNHLIPNIAWVAIFSVFILWVAIAYWYTFASHPYKGIAVREKDILYKKGIFWRKIIIVPYNRVQHLETHRNPIERKLGLSSIKLYSAGGHGADLDISGLKAQKAAQIRQFILDKTKKGLQGNSELQVVDDKEDHYESNQVHQDD